MTNEAGAATREGEAPLLAAMRAMAPAGVLCGCRIIRPGDEHLLLPAEAASLSTRVPGARRASGTARALARALMAQSGYPETAIPRAPSGEPLWPAGLRGSIAHDDNVAVAALGADPSVAALGIDVEPAEPLPADIAGIAVLNGDVLAGADAHLAPRLVFSAKEAFYKAVFPLDRQILDYPDIAIDLGRRTGVTAQGRRLHLTWCLTPRIVVIAYRMKAD